MQTLHVRLLGAFHLRSGDKPLSALDAPRLQSLVAYLILHRGLPQSRRHLAFLLWPDSSEAQARTNLRKALHQVHQALPSAERFLDLEGAEVQWRTDAPFSLDVDEFEQAASRASAIKELEEAVTLYQGNLLPSCYDDWILPEREHLHQLFTTALERLIELLESRRDYATAIHHTQRLLQADPTNETAYRRLMRLFAASGDRASALRTYQECAAVLQRELAVEPSPATREEYERVLQWGSIPNNLPKPLSSFVGRERELVEVKHLLAATRLLMMTGAGGIGKTRLALEAAADVLNDFKEGVWWVELAPLGEASLVPQTVASGLGVREEAGRSILVTLTDALRAKTLLLILDNCEHVIEACAHLAERLLRACPNLKILATSREPLGIGGETILRVPSLSLPDVQKLPPLETLTQYEAVRLFVERAASALPTFTVTDRNAPTLAQVCQRLDGMPLALELAAARVRTLKVEQIADRLDDRFRLLTGGSRTALPRHQTLRATMDWSYDLLSDKERVLLRRLSVFAGGWTLEAAEEVCSAENIAQHEILDLLTELVDKSLVVVEEQQDETRYRMLETVRQYAYEKLEQTPNEKEKFQDRHAESYAAFLYQRTDALKGARQAAALKEIEQEIDNVRTAWRWMTRRGMATEIGQSLEILWFFYYIRGWLREGLESFKAAAAGLSSIETSSSSKTRVVFGSVLGREARFYIQVGLLEQAEELLQKSLAILESNQAHREIAYVLRYVGDIAFDRGKYEQAKQYYDQSQGLSRESGDRWGVGNTLNELGRVACALGEYAEAKQFFQNSLAIFREMGDLRNAAISLNNVGWVNILLGDLEEAKRFLEESIAISKELDSRTTLAYGLDNLGCVANLLGDYREALQYLQEGLVLAKAIGQQSLIFDILNDLGDVTCAVGDFMAAENYFHENLKTAIESQNAPMRLRALVSVSNMLAKQGDAVRAVELLATPLRHPATERHIRAHAERLILELAAELPAKTLAKAQSRAMTLDEAVAYALKEVKSHQEVPLEPPGGS